MAMWSKIALKLVHFQNSESSEVTGEDIMEMIVKAIENDQTYPNYAYNLIHPEFEYKQLRTPIVSIMARNSMWNDAKSLNQRLSQRYGQSMSGGAYYSRGWPYYDHAYDQRFYDLLADFHAAGLGNHNRIWLH